jgi:cell pole-organizing protein PopZ
MKITKPMTMREFLDDICAFRNPLFQQLIIQGTHKLANDLIENEEEYLRVNKHSWLSPEAMLQVSKEFIELYDEFNAANRREFDDILGK